jgi:hypothetical protein
MHTGPKLFAARVMLLTVLTLGAPLQAAAQRVALVIGNSDYQHTSPLANPRNDARALSAKLRSLGFETIEGYDLGISEMNDKTREFARASRTAEISLFFYAGHGIQVDGTNYLVPVDAEMKDELAIDFDAFSIDLILRQMSFSSGANLIILDACRDNPFENLTRSLGGSSRSIGSGGLGEMVVTDTGVGTGIVFATSPGDVAEDGLGEHSPFTEALLAHVGTPNVPFTSIMTRVTGDVYAATDMRQRPWFNQSFTGDVVPYEVAEPEPVVAAPVAPAREPRARVDDAEDERFMFDIARDSGHLEDYNAYLDFYPDGRYARFARLAIERLTPDQPVAAPAADPAPERIAALDPVAAPAAPSEPAAPMVSRAFDASAPLVLTPTQAGLALPATQITEDALLFDRAKRRELQARLNAAGQKVGRTDGLIGPNSRRGIGAWQAANGFAVTGFLNGVQLDLLTSQTEASYRNFFSKPRPTTTIAKRPAAAATPAPTAAAAPDNVLNQSLQGIRMRIQGLSNAITGR